MDFKPKLVVSNSFSQKSVGTKDVFGWKKFHKIREVFWNNVIISRKNDEVVPGLSELLLSTKFYQKPNKSIGRVSNLAEKIAVFVSDKYLAKVD